MSGLSALLPDELASVLCLSPRYRGRQIFDWIHKQLVFDFSAMSNLPESLRNRLKEFAGVIGLSVDARLDDADGAVKFRFQLPDGHAVESVILRDPRGRLTACLSTQVGCAMGCVFCRTGAMGFVRNLTAEEIVDQYLLLRSVLRDREMHGSGDLTVSAELSAVVFMGMGEPLANPENLERAVEVLTFSGFSARRITISTCGLVEGIRRLGRRLPEPRLAVSLVSAEPQTRSVLMPVSRSNPLPELRRALIEYQAAAGKRVTLEIVLIAGVSDRPEDVEALVRFIHGAQMQAPLKVLVNLIPWNPLPEFRYRRPDARRVDWFRRRIRQAGIPATTRISRGSAVCGACGQLGGAQSPA